MNMNDGRRKYTLVLDLDETLLHFEEVSYTIIIRYVFFTVYLMIAFI